MSIQAENKGTGFLTSVSGTGVLGSPHREARSLKPRLLISDDHALVLEGFRRILEEEFEIVGAVNDGRTLVEVAERLLPDVILLDISMPILNGIEAMRKLKPLLPATRFVVVTQRTDKQSVQAAFNAGANAYVVKQGAGAELVTAIREALKGHFYVAPGLGGLEADSGADPTHNPGDLFGGTLTPRQREVLQLVAEGKSAKEIAALLNISPKTVEFHKAAIMDELGIRTTAELTRYAIDQGISVR